MAMTIPKNRLISGMATILSGSFSHVPSAPNARIQRRAAQTTFDKGDAVRRVRCNELLGCPLPEEKPHILIPGDARANDASIPSVLVQRHNARICMLTEVG